MADAGAVEVRLSLTEKELADGIDRAVAKLKLFENQTKNTESGLAHIGEKFTQAGDLLDRFSKVAAVAIAAVAAFVVESTKLAKELDDTAEQLGISTEKLQEFRVAATIAGASGDAVTQSLLVFSREMGNSQNRLSAFGQALGELGLRFDDLRKMKLEDRFTLVLDRLSKLDDSAKRNSLSFELFKRSWSNLSALTLQGSDAMARFADEAKKSGTILDEETIKKGKAAGVEIEKMGELFKSTATRIGAEFLPLLQKMNAELSKPEAQAQVKALASSLKDIIGYLVENKTTILYTMAALGGALFGGSIGGGLGALGGAAAGLVGIKLLLDEIAAREKKAKEGAKELGDALVLPAVGIHGKEPPPEKFWPQLDEAIKELELKRKIIEGDMKGLAAGFPEALKGLNLGEFNALDALSGKLEKLPPQVKAYYAQWLAVNEIDPLVTAAMTETEVMEKEWKKKVAILDFYQNTELGKTQKFAADRKRIEDKYNLDWYKANSAAWSSVAGVIDTSMGQITDLIGSEGAKQFAIFKALSVATAIMKGYEAAVSAYASGEKLAPGLGPVFAAIAIAGTAAYIAKIISTNPDSSSSSAPAAAAAPDSSAASNAATGGGSTNTLVVTGIKSNEMWTGAMVRGLAQKLIEYQKNGGQVVLA